MKAKVRFASALLLSAVVKNCKVFVPALFASAMACCLFASPLAALADVASPGMDAVKACLEGRGDVVSAPGRIFWARTEANCRDFTTPWRYRENAYELYYGDSRALARASYALALHARDIDLSLPVEKFLRGVLGFHYSADQICAWLNDVTASLSPDPALDDAVLAGLLLSDRVIAFRNGRFTPAGHVRHVLAASAGKKRSFVSVLLHERLHVLWDEDAAFRERMTKEWQALPAERKAAEKAALSRYAADNEVQLMKEWAIKEAERINMDLR
jgi:hypothetical protein